MWRTLVLIELLLNALSHTAALGEDFSALAEIHPSCFEQALSRTPQKTSETKIKQTSRIFFLRAIQKIEVCQNAYPELKPYLTAWKEKMGTSQIYCGDDFKEKNQTNSKIYFPPDFFELLALQGNVLERESPSFQKTGFRTSDEALHTFIKKGFSLVEKDEDFKTSSNAQDLNLENIKKCPQKINLSLSNSLTSLCTQEDYDKITKPLTTALYERTLSCDLNLGCIETLAQWKKIEKFQQRQLCNKINMNGACQYLIHTQKSQLLRFEPHLWETRKKLKSRISLFLPKTTAHIPLNLAFVFPDVRQDYIKVRDLPCFKTLFKKDRNGELFTRAIKEPMNYPNPTRFIHGNITLNHHILRIIEATRGPIKTLPMCKDPHTQDAILTWLGGIHERTLTVQKNPIYMTATKRALSPVSHFTPEELPTRLDQHKNSEELEYFLGKTLIEEYVHALQKHHPDSPQYECPLIVKPDYQITPNRKTTPTNSSQTVD